MIKHTSLLIITFLLSTSVIAQSSFKNCSQNEKDELQKMTTDAKEDMERALETLSDYKNLTFRNKLKVADAILILRCSKWRLPRASYTCGIKTDVFDARTLPIVGKEVKLASTFFSKNHAYKVSALIHEATHKCGTADSIDFDRENPPKSSKWIQWQYNASTYQYWSYYGVCVPGIDCK